MNSRETFHKPIVSWRYALCGSVAGSRHNGTVMTSAVAELLRQFKARGDGEAEKSRELTLALLEWSPAPFSRKTFTPGHVTCTGVVLSPDREGVLLVHHRRLNRWLLPGGHVEEEDASAAQTAFREVREETGAEIVRKPGNLVGCDVHPIPARSAEPLHLHHDLIFAFAAKTTRLGESREVRKVVWRPVEDLSDLPVSIQRSVGRALSLL